MFTNRSILQYFVIAILTILAGCQTQPAGQSSGKIRRIVSLSPNITEIIYALGQQDKLVGVTDFCKYPPQATKKRHIGGFVNPNIETIVSLKPDVLIGLPSHADLAQKLQNEHLKFVLLPDDRLADVFFTIDSLGRLLGCETKARHVIKAIQDSLRYYRRQSLAAERFPPKAMLVIGRDPGSTTHITVVGPHTFIDSVWTLMGGKNIFADLPVKYAQVNRENILLKQPDLIIEFHFGKQWNAHKDSLNRRSWQSFTGVPAVKNGQIYVLTGTYTLIPGPRIYKLAADYNRIIQHFFQNKKSRAAQK